MIIECSSDPSERRGVTHRVIIHPDWTVDVPHDIEAERVARSFGGWSTCLELVERVIPAYRRALDLMTNPNHLLSIGGLEDRMPTRVFRHEI